MGAPSKCCSSASKKRIKSLSWGRKCPTKVILPLSTWICETKFPHRIFPTLLPNRIWKNLLSNWIWEASLSKRFHQTISNANPKSNWPHRILQSLYNPLTMGQHDSATTDSIHWQQRTERSCIRTCFWNRTWNCLLLPTNSSSWWPKPSSCVHLHLTCKFYWNWFWCFPWTCTSIFSLEHKQPVDDSGRQGQVIAKVFHLRLLTHWTWDSSLAFLHKT